MTEITTNSQNANSCKNIGILQFYFKKLESYRIMSNSRYLVKPEVVVVKTFS